MPHQLCLREPLSAVVERVTRACCDAAPQLDAHACRELVELVFRARVRQTVACGQHAECRPKARATVRPAGWTDPDPAALPTMFGAAAAALVADVDLDEQGELSRRLAAAFRDVVGPLIKNNPSCGRAEVCGAPPTCPFEREG